MGKVAESIYSGRTVVVPLADVQHIERPHPDLRSRAPGSGLVVVTKHTRWDKDGDFWANNIWICPEEAEAFMRAWCRYRAELEADTLADVAPTS